MPKTLVQKWLTIGSTQQSLGRTSRSLTTGGTGLLVGEGSAPVGTTNYSWPTDGFGNPASNVRFLDSVAGSNSNNGTTPALAYQTFPYALANGPVGMCLVIRGGVYNVGVNYTAATDNNTRGYVAYSYSSSGLTIQSYPGEAVWFDGSALLTGWAASGSYWKASATPVNGIKRRELYTWASLAGKSYPPAVNDNNDTNGWGQYDNPQTGWTYVDYSEKTRASAGRPDRVWRRVKGSNDENAWVQLTQVTFLNQMAVGDWFYGDAYTNEFYIGVDPAIYDIRVTNYQTLFNSLGTNCTIQGIGFRRYAPSLPQQGFMKFHRSGGLIQHCVFEDISGKCLAAIGASNNQGANNMVVLNCTFRRIGNTGLAANNLDYLTWKYCRFEYVNDKLFNPAPEAGCVKYVECRFAHGEQNLYYMCYRGKGVWGDVDNQHCKEINSDFILCGQRGYIYEMGMDIIIAGCRFLSLGAEGIVFMISEDKEIWNCSFYNIGTERGVVNGADTNGCSAIANFTEQRAPRESSRSTGIQNTRDERITNGYFAWDGQNPGGYFTNKLKVRNCVFGASNYEAYWRNQLIGSEAGSAPYISRNWSLDGMDINRNVYNGMAAKQVLPRSYPFVLRLISVQPNGPAQNTVIHSKTDLTTGTASNPAGAMESNGLEIYDIDRCDPLTGMLAPAYQSWGDTVAEALPANIATLMGATTGLKRMGPLARAA